ncbi:unnamed protein product [Psylliodes chrysocephalus]|uniref:RING-CH-type domain-containing protein n=1 Tax=Psylliodes chrysocephalus TaxID=3402493 RepID=A0A9P0CRC9_9CUCU|nr:unnamed protein product [Psylliodes chrysocephala]
MYEEISICPSSVEKLKVEKQKSAKISSHFLVTKPSNPKSPVKVHSTTSVVCRICHTNTISECLISPCNCRGTMEYVHLSCLERWLNQSSRSHCELCMFKYKAIQTKRYKLWQSLKLWARHPRNKEHVRADLLVGLLLTLVTFALITTSIVGMEYFMVEGTKLGVRKKWIQSAVCLFLLTVILGYVVTIYLIIRDQFVPWYTWWTTTVDIHLLLPPSINRKFFRKINATDV